jgi:hypothetical protein
MSDSPTIQATAEYAVEKKEGGDPEKGNANNNDKRSPSADFAALIDAIRQEASANRQEENREDRGQRFRDYLTLFFVMATAAGVFYQAHIFSGQLEEMQSASKQTEQLISANGKLAETGTQQAAAAVKQAEATDKQANALVQSADVSREGMILAQRAWVGPNNAAFTAEPAIGAPIDITVSYQNTGRQPALQFLTSADVIPTTEEEDRNGKFPQRLSLYLERCKNTNEWPGGSVAYPSTGFSTYNFSLKTKDDFVDEAITKGDKLVVLQGCFLYRTFEAARHSYFCYFYKKGQTKIQNLNICTSGHYAD